MKELAALYQKVKEGILLEESYDSSDRISLGAMNEMRNAFDHVMRAVTQNENSEKEFLDARDHILRAGYDTYEGLSMSASNDILDSLLGFDKKVISTIFPAYYNEIKPMMIDLKAELSEIRRTRGNNSKVIYEDSTLNKYIEKAKTLIGFAKRIQAYIPEMAQYQMQRDQEKQLKDKKEKKSFWKNQIVTWIGGFILVILAFLMGYYIRNS
ncbi:MAG: hypothetical protein PHF97_11595 [Bacteroidales bacterium]|nr:hypothetical protein [Bacteroidales bacterium]